MMQEQLFEIIKVKERVVFIYNRFPEAVNFDSVLISKYEELFDSAKFKEDTIKRAGRNLRHKFPERFKRSEAKKEKDDELQNLNVVIWQ